MRKHKINVVKTLKTIGKEIMILKNIIISSVCLWNYSKQNYNMYKTTKNGFDYPVYTEHLMMTDKGNICFIARYIRLKEKFQNPADEIKDEIIGGVYYCPRYDSEFELIDWKYANAIFREYTDDDEDIDWEYEESEV